MQGYKPGDRVGALISIENKVAKFLGYGVYEGEFKLPKYAAGFNFGQRNPRIRLDNGDIVWGCECWWGGEKKFKEYIIERAKKIEMVRIADIRNNG